MTNQQKSKLKLTGIAGGSGIGGAGLVAALYQFIILPMQAGITANTRGRDYLFHERLIQTVEEQGADAGRAMADEWHKQVIGESK